MSDDDPSKSEDELRHDELVEAMTAPTEEERAFYRGRRELGQGVGLDGGGRLICAKDHTGPS